MTNPTGQKREFVCEAKLPNGWSLVTRDFAFELEAHQTDVRLVSFFVPQTAPAGKYEIKYSIKDRKEPSVSELYSTSVVVLAVGKLDVQTLESPKLVIAGQPYKSSFIVTNLGNTDYSITTKIDSAEKMPYSVDAESFTLSPGQSRKVTVTIQTDTKLTKVLNHRVGFTAEALEAGKTKTKAYSKSFVEIIPRISGVEDKYHRIPAELSFKTVAQKNDECQSGFQTEFKGQGTLDEQGTKHLSFGFRGPDIQDKTIFGQRDEYFVSYWTDDYGLHLGDRIYSLSWLTENYLYARGIEGSYNVDERLTVGGYFAKTIWIEPGTEESALSVDYKHNENLTVGLNYLRKLRDGKLSNITSVQGRLTPFKDTHLDLEYALGPGLCKDDSAYLARLYGRTDHLSYYFKLTHAGPDYPGYYSSLDYISGGMTIRFDKNLRLNASIRREKTNLNLDPSAYSASLEKYYQLGLSYRLESDTTFAIDWLSRDRQDRLAPAEFDYKEDTLRLGVTQSFDKLTLHSTAELGQTKNRLDGTDSSAEKYSASVHFRPDSKQTYSGYLYYDKNSDFTGQNRRSTTVGLNAGYNLTNRTYLGMSLQTNDYQDSTGSRDDMEIKLTHRFRNENRFSIIGRHTKYKDSANKDDTALMVQYTIPLGIPVSRKTSVGSIKGYVFDEESSQPMGNVILRLNGSVAVTDKVGGFTFASVKPGTYYLTVDTATTALNKIANRKTPIEITVEGGEKTEVQIPITRSAKITGTIMVYKNDNATAKPQQENANQKQYVTGSGRDEDAEGTIPLANTLVELGNSSGIKRTITDRQGRFTFEEVRPVKWTLKAFGDNLPQYHYFERDTFELVPTPGSETNLRIKVLPKKRQIKIIAEPQTLEESQTNNH